MPELPEVEINMRNLARWARGRTIVEVSAPPGTRETGGVPAQEFIRRLRGRRVEDMVRRGKWILVRLSGGAGLGLHLGMTGKIARGEAGAPPPRFARATFALDRGDAVYFVDSRRFGKLYAVPFWDELLAMSEIEAVGPDALTELTPARLRQALERTSRGVKETIMDQRVAGGIGNLYATEALWRARIHPARKAREVAADPAAVSALVTGIRGALRHGLETYGASVAATPETEPPTYIEEGGENPFYVYDRTGEPCPRCGTEIESMTLGGRTSAYCPTCQPYKRPKRG